ncbi:MAG: type II toxin-antitoxin system VapC family toxin [Planctomycetaceae bacterium]
MSLLLDTHVWIWTQENSDAIGAKARSLLETTSDDLCVSSISSLEIARLVAGGMLELKGSLDRWVRMAIDSLEARSIDVDHRIAIEAYKLPGRFHKDPADRMLVATARVHELRLVTADERILAYKSVRTLDARR